MLQLQLYNLGEETVINAVFNIDKNKTRLYLGTENPIQKLSDYLSSHKFIDPLSKAHI